MMYDDAGCVTAILELAVLTVLVVLLLTTGAQVWGWLIVGLAICIAASTNLMNGGRL